MSSRNLGSLEDDWESNHDVSAWRCGGKDCWLRQRDANADRLHGELAASFHDLKATESATKGQTSSSAVLYSQIHPTQTRLLAITPGAPHEPLSCSLIVVDMTEDGLKLPESGVDISYKALSYTWGTPSFNFPLHCNGVVVGITDTLAQALMAFRAMDDLLPIWVDALCINQRDSQEKTAQVSRMDKVYAGADLVITWMNVPRDETYFTVQVLRCLNDHRQRVHPNGHITVSYDSAIIEQDHSAECIINLRQAVGGLQYVCVSPWFSRTWVRQEAFFARRINLHWGLYSCELRDIAYYSGREPQRDLSGAIDYYTRSESGPPRLPEPPPVIAYFQNPGGDESRTLFKVGSVWLRLLIGGMNSKATDARDLVYAYFGMAEKLIADHKASSRRHKQWTPSSSLRIDYGRSVAQVYQDLAEHLLGYYPLRILQVFEARATKPNDLPSWVPDWRSPKRRLLIEAQLSIRGDKKPRHYWTQHAPDCVPLRHVNGRELMLRGKMYGTVGEPLEDRGGMKWRLSHRSVDTFGFADSVEDCRQGFHKGLGPSEFSPWQASFAADDYTVDDPDNDFDHYSLKEFLILVPGKTHKSWDLRKYLISAMVADTVSSGDLLVWFEGAEVEMIIRPVHGANKYVFLGPAMVRGRRRLVDAAREASLQDFILV